ncbi:P27 family phage terminase small subunit [Adlercreutzia equolifaciens]|uniref:P27 family phage terminase small subunit n=1 Tax=Adlercreutzia equolifaciens TaxID=446660 RepID=UPI0003898393|nr:P27 family phage terminase small subunit [Adlercreutzia equolifaciens]BAN77153.1 phage terminase small subunit [Adlercreutzia equolifaciens DSM 19450]
MAGRQRQPVEVIAARGKTHLTRAGYDERKASQVNVPIDLRDIEPPEYLFQWPERVADFDRYAKMLSHLMPDSFGQPDADLLARYVVSESLYESFTAKLVGLSKPEDIKAVQIAQDRAFKQAHTCASSLGLTVTSRCKLVVPVAEDDGGEEEF